MSESIKPEISLAECEKSAGTTKPVSDEENGLKQIDTIHDDEAIKVLATYQGAETWEPLEEKKLRRQIDWKLLPVLCGTYGLLYYVRRYSQLFSFGSRC